MFLSPVVIYLPDNAPTTVLNAPVVLAQSALYPSAELWVPVVLLRSASLPTAELLVPVVLQRSEFEPTLVLLTIFPPPSPTQTPFATISLTAVKVVPSNVKLGDAASTLALLYIICVFAPGAAVEPEKEPVNEKAVTEPEIFAEPETIRPFLTTNSFAIGSTVHYPGLYNDTYVKN